MAALEELASAQERKTFLDAQSADLNEAINTLTDAITKIASWIGIGIDVYKGKHGAAPKPANANLLDLNDRLGLVPTYDDLTVATLKADFLKLVQKLPADQQERYMKDLDQMTPARFEKGIAFIQNQLSKK